MRIKFYTHSPKYKNSSRIICLIRATNKYDSKRSQIRIKTNLYSNNVIKYNPNNQQFYGVGSDFMNEKLRIANERAFNIMEYCQLKKYNIEDKKTKHLLNKFLNTQDEITEEIESVKSKCDELYFCTCIEYYERYKVGITNSKKGFESRKKSLQGGNPFNLIRVCSFIVPKNDSYSAMDVECFIKKYFREKKKHTIRFKRDNSDWAENISISEFESLIFMVRKKYNLIEKHNGELQGWLSNNSRKITA